MNREKKEEIKNLISFCETNPNLENELLKTGKILGLIK